MYDMGLHGFGMMLGWLIPVALVIFVLYFFQGRDKEPSAREILDKRYANGELTDQEYKTKREALEK